MFSAVPLGHREVSVLEDTSAGKAECQSVLSQAAFHKKANSTP